MTIKFVITVGGILLMFGLLNVLQEKLYKSTYGPSQEKFTYVWSVLFFTTAVNSLCSFAAVKLLKIDGKVPTLYQYAIGAVYLMAMGSTQWALKWVSYPAQVLAKSAKPLPVLILGVIVGKKKHHFARYIVVLLVVAGLVLFMYRDDKAAKSHFKFGAGELLLMFSLLMDGFIASLEERVMSQEPINPVRMMFDINTAAVFFVGYPFVLTGEIFKFACFVLEHPHVMLFILTIAVCTAVGQFFIFLCITNFGTLTCSIVTTVRKSLTLLGSIVLFGHVLQFRQWLGTGLVFTGLLLDIYYGKFHH